jgi:hypothetical protein
LLLRQLKDVEAALLQRFEGARGGWQRGNGKRQRLGDGMFGDAGSGSEDESGPGEGLSLSLIVAELLWGLLVRLVLFGFCCNQSRLLMRSVGRLPPLMDRAASHL